MQQSRADFQYNYIKYIKEEINCTSAEATRDQTQTQVVGTGDRTQRHRLL